MTSPSIDDIDTITRGLLYGATGRQETTQETLPLGAAISTLNATEAVAFADACEAWCALRRKSNG